MCVVLRGRVLDVEWVVLEPSVEQRGTVGREGGEEEEEEAAEDEEDEDDEDDDEGNEILKSSSTNATSIELLPPKTPFKVFSNIIQWTEGGSAHGIIKSPNSSHRRWIHSESLVCSNAQLSHLCIRK